ncbi:hypothetical protein GCM10028791_15750 [Echinicola sediminis]
MKLRLNNNSIRLRLSQTEVQQIAAGETVTEMLYLGSSSLGFGYSMVPDSRSEQIEAIYADNHLKIIVPQNVSKAWAVSEEVTIRQVLHEGLEHENLLLIEKDFQCLHKRPDEDESDNFPNPKSLEDYQNCEKE